MSVGKSLFYVDEHGNKQDASLHAEMLDHPEAHAEACRQAVQRAIRQGMDPHTARELYGNRTPQEPVE